MTVTKEHLGDRKFGAALDYLTPLIGPADALSFALMGTPVAWAVTLASAPAGRRLLSYDPADLLTDSQVACVLGCGISEFAQLVTAGRFPQPDRPGGGTEFKNGAYSPVIRSWECGTIARWLGAGCPHSETGLRNNYLADRYGARS